MKSDRGISKNRPMETIFLAAITFTTQFDFSPRTHPAWLFAFSLSFWAMLVTAAYTANLSSFLVVKNTPTLQINSVTDAVRSGLPICVFKGTQADEALESAYSNANLIRKDSDDKIFEGVLQGDCTVAVTTVSSWGFWERDASINENCNLEWIRRTFRNVLVGFATKAD